MLHRPLLAEVGDTLAQPRHQVAQAAVRFAQQQSPAVRRHPPTIEIRDHVALAVRLELQLLRRQERPWVWKARMLLKKLLESA